MFKIRTASTRRTAFGAGSGGGGSFMGSSGSGGTGNSGGGGGRGSTNIKFNPVFDDLSEGTIIEQFMPVDPRRLHRIWRRIYLQDAVAGAAVELYKDIPWSDWQITGIADPAVNRFYEDAYNALNLVQLMPELTAEFLSMGKFTLHLLMNESKGYFDTVIPINADFVRITPIPVAGFQPKIDFIPTPEMRKFATSEDPRDVEAQDAIRDFIDVIRSGGEVPLAPSNTIYVPRKVSPDDMIGASIYTRIVMFVAYEKALVNATISAAKRRAGRIRHLTIGIDDVWDPTAQEMDDIAALFMQADEDPVGAIVATRTGIETNEVGGNSPQDMLRVSDEWEFLTRGKMSALGISDSFLTGEANFSTMETQLSIFLERVRAHRDFMTARVQMEIAKRLARKHEFRNDIKKSELSHRYRMKLGNGETLSDSQLILPKLVYSKALRPVADKDYLDILDKMEEKGIPVPVREWAAAGGVDIGQIQEQLKTDIGDRKLFAAHKKEVAAFDEAGTEGFGGGGGMGGMDGGMDMGGMGGDMGGGMDMGGMGGGDMGGGDMGGGEPSLDLGGGELPGAADMGVTAAHVRTGASHDRVLRSIDRLPVWDRDGRMLNVKKMDVINVMRKLRDRPYSPTELTRLANVGNQYKEQLVFYILSRVGVLKGVKLHAEVAADIAQWIITRTSQGPESITVFQELKALQAMIQQTPAGQLKAAASSRNPKAQHSWSQFSKPSSNLLTGSTASLSGVWSKR